MLFNIEKSSLKGSVRIPGSKSHTIRALVFALLAHGKSKITAPLVSSDTTSCRDMIENFGAMVELDGEDWTVKGRGNDIKLPDQVIDVGNSGTALYMGMGVASLCKGWTIFTGDGQIRSRPAQGLLSSLSDLGVKAVSSRNNGMPPLMICGPLKGGYTELESVTSQYLSSLLIAAPMAREDTRIELSLLNEKPYIDMTLDWLDRLGVRYENHGYDAFTVYGGQNYKPFERTIPADFSSATFFLVAAAVTGSEIEITGLDFEDTQGDKEVVSILRGMGVDFEITGLHLRVKGGQLKGGTFDLNSIPDSLPALAVAGCFAKGETRLVNVSQARLKETDRISVMSAELKKMGADVEELPDGLVIRESALRGARLNGHHDHRVVMALSVAALASEGKSSISTAESASVTFPGFKGLMNSIGAKITENEE